MVARTVTLPNIRKIFVPDPGYVMLECDLERADAAVVAWEADDEELKQIFREGLDLHTENARAIFNTPDISHEQRQKAKVGIHAINYDVRARTLAIALGITVREAEWFINRWFEMHPGIKRWHERTALELRTSRTTTNAFGFKTYWFDRLDNLLSDALAYIPQSTVGIVTYLGWINITETLPSIHVLNQVHDSLVMQVPEDKFSTLLPLILDCMRVPVPYPDPLIIGVEPKASAVSWGDCEKIEGNLNVSEA